MVIILGVDQETTSYKINKRNICETIII